MDLTTNYFELFGLPVGYEVEQGQLSSQYRLLQQQFHPDRFAHASEQERRLSLQMASRVNEGSHVLRDPIARARYLLELHGTDLGSDSETLRDPEFLMEQMELREELEMAQQSADAVTALEQFVEKMEAQIRQRGRQFSTLWQHAQDAAKSAVQQMQFFYRLAHQAESMIDELV